jgi:F1F0 ATPase subunit 2
MESDAQRMIELIVLRLAAFVTLGALLGFSYLTALGLNVRLYLESGTAWLALLVHAVRVLVTVAAFALCAHRGALDLISSVAGFHVMRTVAIHRATLAPARK